MGQQQSSNQSSVVEMGGMQEPTESEEITWWCRILIKIIAGIAGIIGFVTGIITALSFNLCVLAGILMVLVSLLLLIFELPICCTFIEITKPIAAFAEHRTFFQRAFIYGGLAIPPVIMCPRIGAIIGCACIFAVGVFYGILALGRKADRSVMMARAAGDQNDLVNNDQLAVTTAASQK